MKPKEANMYSCCGKERDGRFCPECGWKLDKVFGLFDLLKHCEDHADRQAQRAREARGTTGRNGKKREGHQRQMERAAIKWRTWATLLRQLLILTPDP